MKAPTRSLALRSLAERHALFGAYILALLLFQWDLIAALAAVANNDATASHHLLIPIVTLVLVLQQRRTVFSTVRVSPVLGGFWIAAGVAFALSGRLFEGLNAHDRLTLATASLVALTVGGFAILYGASAFRAALFPLLFLGFTIPIPTIVLQQVTVFLKAQSAEAVAGLFTMTGTPYHRELFVFSLPTAVIQIADECSGIRSSIALLLTSLLAGHLFLQRSASRILLVIAILPIAIIKNAARIVSLALLAMHVDPGFLTGQLHHEGGIVFFLLGLALLAPLFILLQWSEMRRVLRVFPA